MITCKAPLAAACCLIISCSPASPQDDDSAPRSGRQQGPASEPTLEITGPEEIYLSHTTMTCDGVDKRQGSGRDVTDVPVSAFRRADGSVIVLAGNQNNWYLEGASVNDARRTSCNSLILPTNDSDPSHFNARRWVFGLFAKNDDLVLGFVHNEYHGDDFHPECIVETQRDYQCWYGSTTLIESTDGGFTFTTPDVPENVIAALPRRFSVDSRRAGINTPKVVGGRDNYVYILVNFLDRDRNITAGQCLLRGSGESLNDWRGWNGRDFVLNMESPYVISRSEDCVKVIDYVVQSVKFVPSIQKYVAIGVMGPRVVYSFSEDMIKWSDPRTLMRVKTKQGSGQGDQARSYFSLLDSTSGSRNFDTLEAEPYLYFVQYITGSLQRDVYRVPVALRP